MVALAAESLRWAQWDRADRGQAILIVNGNDLEILHIVRRGRPSGRIENQQQVRLRDCPSRVERRTARVSLPHDFE